MTIQVIDQKMTELREKVRTAAASQREIVKRQYRALEIARELCMQTQQPLPWEKV